MHKNIITTCLEGMPGVRRAFETGHNLDFWTFVPFEEIGKADADLLILGAWSPAYAHLLKTDAKIAILWCSSLGEMWLTPVEFTFLKHVLSSPDIDYVLFGDYETHEAFHSEKTRHMPYPVNLTIDPGYLSPQKDGICVFTPYTLKKNTANEIAAVRLLQKKKDLMLHLNHPEAAKLADFFGVKYQYHGWMPWYVYYKTLGEMQVSLQVSYAESFGYSSLEAVLLGVAPVTSPTVRWNLEALTVHDANSPKNIAEVLELALSRDWSQLLRERVNQLATANNALLEETLHNILGE